MVAAKHTPETLTGIVKGYDRLTTPSGAYSQKPNTIETIAIKRKPIARITPKFDSVRFQAKTEDLADRLFPHGYEMRFNNNRYQAHGPEQVVIDLDVGDNGRTMGTLEVYLGKRFKSNIDASIKFICCIAEYVGADIGTRQDLMKEAHEAIPDIKSPTATQKAIISLTNGTAKVSFQTTNNTSYIKSDTNPYLKFA